MFEHLRKLQGCVIALFLIILAPTLRAQQQDYYAFVRADWHLAGIAEYQSDWRGAIEYYQQAVEHSASLPLVVREWYRGTAEYGIARCSARIHEDSASRTHLDRAFHHHFWNSPLIRLDSLLVSACGSTWLDSESQFWATVCAEERPTWHAQPPLIYYPNGYDSTDRWPLIIAMHGGNGNYESFAERWPEMANLLKAVIVVPAGIIRESEITNSWGSNMDAIEGPILKIASDFTHAHRVDASQVYLTGFSQGAQASIELTLRHPDIFHGAIAMSGFTSDPPNDSALAVARARGVRIYAISGEYEDPTFHAQIQGIHDLCAKGGIPFDLTIVPGMIHEVPLDLRTKFLAGWNWVRPPAQAAVHRGE
ncbi:MAG: PHB depolymerase family esterase [Bacteroidota bacterium]|nr:PHB depolymerase family esterase [Bacteroidota bacterium]MDP4233606.1 PHB depolymerase family esterase [Bacteroidota bacterium]MDP4243134.1 PHB depolymerase family esterase [Bacteroidota bacterium]MDP4288534.1 PHB depolymerase family esterase [Bacteroidota bacterium]